MYENAVYKMVMSWTQCVLQIFTIELAHKKEPANGLLLLLTFYDHGHTKSKQQSLDPNGDQGPISETNCSLNNFPEIPLKCFNMFSVT